MTDQTDGKVARSTEGPRVSLPAGADRQQLGILMARLLVGQCAICHVRAGAVLVPAEDGSIGVLAVCPSPDKDQELVAWLQSSAQAARQVLSDPSRSSGPWQVLFQPSSDLQSRMATVLISMDLPQVGRFIEAFAVPDSMINQVQVLQHRLVQSVRMIEAYDQQLAIQGPARRLQTVSSVMAIISAVERLPQFVPAAMEFCNQLAAVWGCDRVSLGILSGRMVKVKAISHTERFSRKTRPIQLIEAAMEEALDQQTEVIWPAPQDELVISRAAGELAAVSGAKGLFVVPLEEQTGPAVVVLAERSAQFDQQTLDGIRLACQICGPLLSRLWSQGRWFGARIAHKVRAAAAVVVGPRYTWVKLVACLVAAFAAWSIIGKGQYRVHAPFALSAEVLQGICAPFDGYLKQVHVEVGQTVEANKTILAELDTAELRLQLASAKAELASYLKQVDAYMRDGQTAKAQVAQADADKIQAQIDLLGQMIEKAALVSPIDGTVVKGDLKKQVGGPVKTGQVLFEVAPLEGLYAELFVPEDQVLDLAVGQKGALATASFPGQRLPIVVERINPMAEVVNGRNVFRVRATLEQTTRWLRPGMEGVAKVDVDRRPYIWIWTRKLINWIRMKLWI